jgi:hypothetical protein
MTLRQTGRLTVGHKLTSTSTSEKSTNQQNHKPATCMTTAQHKHKKEPMAIMIEKQYISFLEQSIGTFEDSQLCRKL